MLFIKLIESLRNTRIYFRYFIATYYKKRLYQISQAYRVFLSKFRGRWRGFSPPDKRYIGGTNFCRYKVSQLAHPKTVFHGCKNQRKK